jgi:hypothetical protein
MADPQTITEYNKPSKALWEKKLHQSLYPLLEQQLIK